MIAPWLISIWELSSIGLRAVLVQNRLPTYLCTMESQEKLGNRCSQVKVGENDKTVRYGNTCFVLIWVRLLRTYSIKFIFCVYFCFSILFCHCCIYIAFSSARILHHVNSAFHPSGIGKSSTISLAWVKAGCAHLSRAASKMSLSENVVQREDILHEDLWFRCSNFFSVATS